MRLHCYDSHPEFGDEGHGISTYGRAANSPSADDEHWKGKLS
jgi:hypothetical protein